MVQFGNLSKRKNLKDKLGTQDANVNLLTPKDPFDWQAIRPFQAEQIDHQDPEFRDTAFSFDDDSALLIVSFAAKMSFECTHSNESTFTPCRCSMKDSTDVGLKPDSNAIAGNNSVIDELRVVSPIPPFNGFKNIKNL